MIVSLFWNERHNSFQPVQHFDYVLYIDCVKDTHEKVFENDSIVFDDTYSKYESLW